MLTLMSASIVLAAQEGTAAEPGKQFNLGKNMFLSGEALFLKRSGGKDRVLWTGPDGTGNDVPANGPVWLRSGDLNDGFAPGFRIAGGLRLRPGLWLVADVMYIRWSESRTRNSTNNAGEINWPWPLNDWPSASDGSRDAKVEYSSNLLSVGFKAKYRVNRWLTIFGGPRYYRLAENLDMRSCDINDDIGTTCSVGNFGTGTDQGQYLITTSNNLIGGEIGATAKFRVIRRLYVAFTGTVGAFGNYVTSNQTLTDQSLGDNQAPVDRLGRDQGQSKAQFSFVGTAKLRVFYKINYWLTVFAGYQMIYMTGLATAPSQLDFSLTDAEGVTNGGPPTSTTSLRASDNLIFHGGLAGIKIHW